MSKKLYVGNLPFSTTEDQLRELFGAHGTVTSASLIIDKMTGRSRGFGFVEMEDGNAADNAIASLHNADVDGRKIVVNEARPMAPRQGGGGGGGGFGGGRRREGGNRGGGRW